MLTPFISCASLVALNRRSLMATINEPLTKMHPLRAYRMHQGLSQAKLAKKLGVGMTIIALWETRKRRIPPLRAVAIEKKTGVKRAVLCPEVFGPNV
jgi:DNA-binding transcriptional regulator YiaG